MITLSIIINLLNKFEGFSSLNLVFLWLHLNCFDNIFIIFCTFYILILKVLFNLTCDKGCASYHELFYLIHTSLELILEELQILLNSFILWRIQTNVSLVSLNWGFLKLNCMLLELCILLEDLSNNLFLSFA